MPSNYLLFDYPAFDVTLNKLGRVKLSLTKNHFYDIPEIEINLTNADIYNILLLLKQKEEWVKVIKRIIEIGRAHV